MTQTPSPYDSLPKLSPPMPPLPAPADNRPTSPLAIAALVLGILGIIPFVGIFTGFTGIVLGIVALAQKSKGAGLAMAGIISGAVGMVVVHAIIIAGLIPAMTGSRDLARRAICAANLNGIGKAMALYYPENRDAFPTLRAEADDPDKGPDWRGAPDSAADVYALKGTFPQDNLSLLVYKGIVSWNMFLCPSQANKVKDRSGTADMYGFGRGGNPVNANRSFTDYGLHIPQRYTGPKTEHKAWLGAETDPTLIIMADRPDPSDLAGKFSPNHGHQGENILAFGGNVRWADDEVTTGTAYKNSCGWGQNSIYQFDMDYTPAPARTAQPGFPAPGPSATGTGTLNRAKAAPPGPTASPVDSVIYWRGN